MSWGTRRRNFIIAIFLVVVFAIIAIIGFLFFYEEPTCFDGKQNGGEVGIDCGGQCNLLCSTQTLDPFIKWNRYFEVIPGLYNVVAYIENQNPNARTENLEYKFTLYDEESAIIAERVGSIDLNPKEINPIVESGLNTGRLRPERMTFEITNDVIWTNADPVELVLFVKDEELKMIEGNPRVSAVIENTGFETLEDVNIVVILYDLDDNAIGTSSTYIDIIRPTEEKNILFTWPANFSGNPVRFDILPLYESE